MGVRRIACMRETNREHAAANGRRCLDWETDSKNGKEEAHGDGNWKVFLDLNR